VALDAEHADRPVHDRLRHLDGDLDDATLSLLAEEVGSGSALVVLGREVDRDAVYADFLALSPLVSVGSYVVVTNTIVNGHPVWAGFGPGPAEAVKKIMTSHGDFVPDTTMEKYSLSYNPGGFLKRVR
jgi:cephalosporin hydroxylase